MSWFGHHHHNQPAPPASGPNQVFKIFCRANDNYCLAVRDGAVVLAPANPKDEEGMPAGLRARQQGHRTRHQALTRPVPPGIHAYASICLSSSVLIDWQHYMAGF